MVSGCKSKAKEKFKVGWDLCVSFTEVVKYHVGGTSKVVPTWHVTEEFIGVVADDFAWVCKKDKVSVDDRFNMGESLFVSQSDYFCLFLGCF